ncbi:hypothetical protein CY34DRAFT_801019 [Suillus luteus UH-Slu-Lm8-n1]|uniref:NYN domain-containing protein n=1 Tax=Suillus luteus UH-Slu-Lm8-n1 TaxID=930992 RepID=A0A0D0BIM1_9AGAM|nr:hypothetical protein CY34DRAFT_801019 [Suillus luteus UH-Slu-Lm8-n1]
MSNHRKVAIFWDYENCSPPLNSQGHAIVNGIRRIAHVFGYVTSFKAYFDMSSQSSTKSVGFRSDLQSSGVSIIDCPHNGRKEVVDKMILVDMIAFAVDNPSPATIILIAGDRDYAYAISTLRLRQYTVVLIVPPAPNIPQSLESQASVVVDWNFAILGKRTEADAAPVRQPYRNLDEDIVERLSREIRDSNEDPAVTLLSSNFPTTPGHTRRVSAEELLQPPAFEQDSDPASGDATQPASTCTSKKVGSTIPETPVRPRFESVASRARSATQSTHNVPDIEQGSGSPLKEHKALSNESLVDGFVSCANEIQDATQDPFAGTLTGLQRNQNSAESSLPPSTGSPNFTLSPPPAVTFSVNVEHAPLPFSSHTRTISGGTPVAFGSISQNTVPTIVPLSPVFSRGQNDVSTASKPANIDPTSAMLDNHAVASDKAALEDAFGIDDDDRDDNGSTSDEFGASADSPLWTKVDDFSHTEVANSPYDSPPAHSVISLSPASSSAPSPSSPSSLSLTADGSDVSPSNVDNSPQQATSVMSDYKDKPPTECQAPLTKSVEDEIRLIATPRFLPLINLLLLARSKGEMKSSRSAIAVDLVKSDKNLYKRVGVTRFAQYTALAEKASLVKLTARKGATWIELHPNLYSQDVDSDPGTSSTPSTVHNDNSPIPPDNTPYTKTPAPHSGTTPPSSAALPSTIKASALNPKAPPFVAVPIPLCFQPLVACLTKAHNAGIAEPLRSAVDQALGFAVYSEVGMVGLREYLTEAIYAGVVECGHNWVKLHPDVRSGKRSC